MQDEQRDEEEKRQAIEEEEKKITGSSGSGADGEVPKAALAVELPNELVVLEVLTRLPVKSLMRFKCVSNLWRSTISQDPSFSKIHRARHSPSRAGGLFITYPDADDSLRCFYATTLPSSSCSGGGESVLVPHQFTATASNSCSKYNGATDVVKGLFCLYAGNRSWICNVSTREIKVLPFSSDLENSVAFTYFLGFASTSKEYKLLKFCFLPFYDEGIVCVRALICEILTMGKDASWRRPWDLLESPEVDLSLNRTNVYIDGFLCCWHLSGFTLIVFNFEDESFQEIYPPPKSSGSLYSEDGSLLLQFGGHFALVRGLHSRRVNQELKIWVLELNKYKQGSYEWINRIIEVPWDFPVRGCSFTGNLPLPRGDQMLLTGLVEFTNNKTAVPVYSFDHTKGKFEKLVIGNFPSWSSQVASIYRKDVNKFRVYYYEEDITPWNDLVISDNELGLTAASCTKKEKKRKKKKKSSRTTSSNSLTF